MQVNIRHLIKECVIEVLKENLSEGFDPQGQGPNGPDETGGNPYEKWNSDMRKLEEINWVSPVSAYEDGFKNGKADKSLGLEPLGLKAGMSPNQKAYSQGYYDGYYNHKGNEYSKISFIRK